MECLFCSFELKMENLLKKENRIKTQFQTYESHHNKEDC